MKNGYAGLFYPDTDESIFFKFDTRVISYLGLWLCYGGWPQGKKEKHFTVALEPASGRPDSLSEAVKNNECKILKNGKEHQWTLYIVLQKGREVL